MGQKTITGSVELGKEIRLRRMVLEEEKIEDSATYSDWGRWAFDIFDDMDIVTFYTPTPI